MLENSRKVLVIIAAIILFNAPLTVFSSERISSRASRIAGGAVPAQRLGNLESLLNTNGTLNLNGGYSGSLDVRGWKMLVGSNGEPHFVRQEETKTQPPSTEAATLPDDVNWDDRFARPGIASSTTFPTVHAVTVSGGNVYVGGTFNKAGGPTANNIAKWDGKNWSTLGDGVDDTVRAIAVAGNDVYVGGDFLHAGGVEANGVAKWDGTRWSALGSGIARTCPGCLPTVTAIAVIGSDLYVGGPFTSAGGINANSIAKWDGTRWSAVGRGLVATLVRSIAVNGADIYVAGNVAVEGSDQVEGDGVAKWDGTRWSTVGGVFGQANVVEVMGSDLYVGGFFEMISGVRAKNIAKWDGTRWSALGSGIEGEVSALKAIGGDLYAGININVPFSGPPADRILKWDGANWSKLASGVSHDLDNRTVHVFALAANGSDLYVGGSFILAGGFVADMLAKWNGTAWSVLGDGMNGTIEAMLADGRDLYVGGAFNSAGGVRARCIAKWDGANWSAFGSGIEFTEVIAIAISEGNLYVGGRFNMAGGVSANNIAKWDGTSWSNLGNGLTGCSNTPCQTRVNAIAVSGSDVYVGGSFRMAGGVSASAIAKWNGSRWSALGTGISGQVNALALSGSNLYVGGFFNLAAGGGVASNIAVWDGANWSALGSGVSGAVFALATSGSDLYVGGGFMRAGGRDASNIAVWDGTRWSAPGSGVNGPVFALAVNRGILYAGGQFSTAGGVSAKDIARWNGNVWSALGSGVSLDEFPGFALAVAVSGNDVYVGGIFSLAGGKPSNSIARWSDRGNQTEGPVITAASVSGKKLIVSGRNFDIGAAVLLNGKKQKTTNDGDNPSAKLIAKKAGKKVKAGDKIQVRNSDGQLSEEFTVSVQ